MSYVSIHSFLNIVLVLSNVVLLKVIECDVICAIFELAVLKVCQKLARELII